MKKFTYLAATLLVMVGAVSCKDNSSVREPEYMQSTGEMRSATIADEGRPACQSALDDDSNWVKIGGLYWLKENTKCVEYDTESEAYNADWLAVPNTIPTSEWVTGTPYYTAIPVSQKPSYMSEGQFSKLGMLYNWAAAMGYKDEFDAKEAYSGTRQGICPNGSHIPTVEEWNVLADALGGKEVAGKKVKTKSGWSGKGNGTDEYGFAALPAGLADGNRTGAVGDRGYFWTATPNEDYSYQSYVRYFISDYELMYDFYMSYVYGLSVRCVKDYSEELNTPAARPVCQRALDDDSNWVKIGSQYWLRENTKCIEYDTESEAYNAAWLFGNTISESARNVYTPYYTPIPRNKKPSYMSEGQFNKLGVLYNWAAAVGVKDGEKQTTKFKGNRQGICPNGSHIPTEEEWDALETFIEKTDGKGYKQAGKYLKGTSGWFSSWYINGNGEDTYGFAALPAGLAYGNSVSNVGNYTYFWTATPVESFSNIAHFRYLNFNYDCLYVGHDVKYDGLSVRCLRD
ncbi:MAG: hypothetical protein MJ010_01195 [Paludibacteraceae bacterium]|nr:hypothetical protein [Paludibacteraceae bacterium]